MPGTTAAPLTCNLFPSRLQEDILASRNLPTVSKPFYLKLFHSFIDHRVSPSGGRWALDIGDGRRLWWQSRLVQHQEICEHERSQLEKWTAQNCWWPLHVCPILWQVSKPNLCINGWLLAEKKIRLPGNDTTLEFLIEVLLPINFVISPPFVSRRVWRYLKATVCRRSACLCTISTMV
jgi:hypothetical protein